MRTRNIDWIGTLVLVVVGVLVIHSIKHCELHIRQSIDHQCIVEYVLVKLK